MIPIDSDLVLIYDWFFIDLTYLSINITSKFSSRLPLRRMVFEDLARAGPPPSSATLCKVSASLASTKSSRTSTPTCLERKTATCGGRPSIWPLLPLPNSSLTSLLAQWRLSRFDFFVLVTIRNINLNTIQVRIQTQPGFVSTLREAVPLMYKDEGFGVFYKSLVPLWMRQIPYTMMKFACFERTVELIYK